MKWHPHVGCFVWDPDNHIKAGSPFPHEIYYILSLPGFLDIFGSIEAVAEKLVWLPTWHQAWLLCQQMGSSDQAVADSWQSRPFTTGQELRQIYAHTKEAPLNDPYLILNGEGKGLVNSMTVPSIVAPSYAPAGEKLIPVVILGHLTLDNRTVESVVRKELTDWFGLVIEKWRHLKTYRIEHALPA
jgi:hypothetical protein